MDKTFEKISLTSTLFFGFFIYMAFLVFFMAFGVDNTGIIRSFSQTFIVILILYMIKRNGDKLDLNFNVFKTRNVKLEALKILILNIAFSIGIGFLITRILYIINPPNLRELMNETPLKYGFIINFMCAVIIAPIFEEFLFRGVIFSRLSKKLSPISAMIISSLIFGLLHIKLSIIGAFVFGMMLCILFKKYNNLLINISIHMLNNFIGVMQVFIPLPNFSIENCTPKDLNQIFIVGIILTIPAVFFIAKYMKNNWHVLKEITNSYDIN